MHKWKQKQTIIFTNTQQKKMLCICAKYTAYIEYTENNILKEKAVFLSIV